MSFDFVGLENLPNVYFEKLELHDNDGTTMKVVAKTIVLDEVDEVSFVWSDDPLMLDYSKVAVVCTTNLELIAKMSNGEIIPHPSVIRAQRELMNGTEIRSTSIKEMTITTDIDSRRYRGTFDFLKPLGSDSVALFAFTYVDMLELSKSLRIKLTGPLNYYSGAVVSEDLLRGGTIEEITYVYRKSDNTIWKGPIHQDADGRWMTGSFHSEDSEFLTREEVKNTKIIDRRADSLSRRMLSEFSSKPIFSELTTSFNPAADLIGMFSIDFRTLLYRKTKHGRKMFNVSKGMFEEVAKGLEINSLEIRRQQIRQKISANKLGTRATGQELIGSYRTIAATIERQNRLVDTDKLSQAFLVSDPLIKSYQFTDNEMSEKTRGEFRYEVVLSFIDKTDVLLRGYVAQMRREITQLKTQANLLFRPSRYDREQNKVRPQTLIPSIFSEAVSTYYNMLSTFMDFDDDKKAELVSSKRSLFSNDNYTNAEAEKFIADYSALVTRFKVTFDLREVDTNFNRRDNTRKQAPKGLISINHVFSNNINFRSVSRSYDYLGISLNSSIPTFTKDDYLSRGTKEVGRFFDTSKSIKSSELMDYDEEDATAIMDLEYSKVGFFSPLSFKFGEKSNDLSSLSTADSDSISFNFINHLQEERKEVKVNTAPKKKNTRPKNKRSKINRRTSIKKKRFGRMKFNFSKLPFKINNLKTEEYLDVSKYLGDNSEMANVESNLKDPVIAPNNEQVMKKVEITTGITVKREKKSFDLTQKNNIVDKFKASPAYAPEKLRRLPVSIKSLLASRSSAAKNNILESEADTLKDPETKVSSEMIFHATQKIQYFDGFEMDADGTPNMSKPKWSDMTPEALETQPRLFCRMVYAEMPELDIKPAPEFKLLAQNSQFIISNESISTPIQIVEELDPSLEIQQELPEVNEIVYASSNYVKQSSFRRNLMIEDKDNA